MEKFFVVFDTNILFKQYNKRGNFKEFSFNSTFQNVIDMVNEFDIYEHVSLIIPDVVWNEMLEQEIKNHNEKLIEFKEKVDKYEFPEVKIKIDNINYRNYLETRISEYKKSIQKNVNKIIGLPLPTKNRYDSIVGRAFAKKPPFEGKDKKSDKGFKDALLWESILEFAQSNDGANLVFYTNDKIFSSELEIEFSELFPNSTLKICNDETQIREKFATWAKEIDEFAFIPENVKDTSLIEKWIRSEEFEKDVLESGNYLFEESRLLTLHRIEVFELINISDFLVEDRSDIETDYEIEAILKISYKTPNEDVISTYYHAFIEVVCYDEAMFSIDSLDGYYEDEEEED